MLLLLLLNTFFFLTLVNSQGPTIDATVNKTHIYAPELFINPVQTTPNGGVPLVVKTTTSGAASAIASLIQNSQTTSTNSPTLLEGVITKSNVVVATLDDSTFSNMLSGYGASVKTVEYDYVFSASAIQVQTPCESWGLARISTRVLYQLGMPYTYTTCVQQVHVYVLDTGINTAHPDFEGRAENLANFSWDLDYNGDQNGHGTIVAGLIGGKTHGVAKTVKMLGVKVLNYQGGGTLSGILAGLDLIIQRLKAVQQQNPNYQNVLSIVNLSLEGPRSPTFNDMIDQIYFLNAFVATAAGNGFGEDACQISPASASRAFTVAASDKTDKQAYFSNCGSCVKAFAPGQSVPSTSLNGFGTYSGTSISSPIAAGIAALYACSKPYWNVVDITNDLINRAAQSAINGVCPGTTRRMLYNRQ